MSGTVRAGGSDPTAPPPLVFLFFAPLSSPLLLLPPAASALRLRVLKGWICGKELMVSCLVRGYGSCHYLRYSFMPLVVVAANPWYLLHCQQGKPLVILHTASLAFAVRRDAGDHGGACVEGILACECEGEGWHD